MAISGKGFRMERDSMGFIKVPETAYYGAQTQRAIENFPISGWRFQRNFIQALGLIKFASARVNGELGLLKKRIAKAIEQASQEVAEGIWDHQFLVDIFQTGSGTSTNMNANEIIANRANEILGGSKGVYQPIHPNDHVNMGQSTNDVFPSAIHIAAVILLQKELIPSLKALHRLLKKKEKEFYPILKIGRTHLQDATPIRLGHEFGGYARQVELGIERIKKAMHFLFELPLGGTAVGTGINTHPLFAKRVISLLKQKIKYPFHEALNHFEAQSARDALVEMSATLRVVAVSLIKIANDLRWLGSGPRCAIGEIHLPEIQPGSSIMPGKVNPVIPESLIQICAQVIGNDLAITLAGIGGNFELNTMMPLMAHNLLESIRLLAHGVNNFSQRCVAGLKADRKRCEEMLERSLALATALTPRIGYDKATEIAQKAYEQQKTIRQILEEEGIFSKKELNRLLDAHSMLIPSKKNPAKAGAREKRINVIGA